MGGGSGGTNCGTLGAPAACTEVSGALLQWTVPSGQMAHRQEGVTADCSLWHGEYKGVMTMACSFGVMTVGSNTCQLNNPCTTGENDCHATLGVCTHTGTGTHTCACSASYGDGRTCQECPSTSVLADPASSLVVSDCQCPVGFTVNVLDSSNPRTIVDASSDCAAVQCQTGAQGAGGGAGGCTCSAGYFGTALFDAQTNTYEDCLQCDPVANSVGGVTCPNCRACSRVSGCAAGYHRVAGTATTADTCVENVCTCLGAAGASGFFVEIGTGSTNTACPTHNAPLCIACNEKFFFRGDRHWVDEYGVPDAQRTIMHCVQREVLLDWRSALGRRIRRARRTTHHYALRATRSSS